MKELMMKILFKLNIQGIEELLPKIWL
jgi:hypothetical protein